MQVDFLDAMRAECEKIGLTANVGFLPEADGLQVYSLAGGQIVASYMDGSHDVRLPFEFAIKTDDQKNALNVLWKLQQAITAEELEPKSLNGSYQFSELSAGVPFLSAQNAQNKYIYMLEVTAYITTTGGL